MKFLGPSQNMVRGAIILFLILAGGTIGYKIIEGWSFLDSLFMTVTTISTVGYSEVHPLSTTGRIFSIFLILCGIGAVFYILTTLVQYIIEGEFGIRIGRQRMEAKIKRLSNHFIICGHGRVGEAIAHALEQQGAKFVVIDQNQESINKAQQSGYLTIMNDATRDESLRKARIDNARGLIVALGDDADNTYTTLAARQLNSTLPIIARANSEGAKRKLQLAGAYRVIAPEAIGGQRMAMLALRPAAVEFVETVLFGQEKQLLVEDIETGEDSPLVGSTIQDIEDRFSGVKILAVKKANGTLVASPNPKMVIEGLSDLTAFGTAEQLQAVEGYCASNNVEDTK